MRLSGARQAVLVAAVALGGYVAARAQQPNPAHVQPAGTASADPNLPKGKGVVLLFANPLGANGIAYAYQGRDIPTALVVNFGDRRQHIMVYLGYNDQGTWMYEQDTVYLLKGSTFRRAPVNSVAEVPNGLKNPSPQYLTDHTGMAVGRTVAASAGSYSNDPEFPNASGEVAVLPNQYRITKVFYQYPNGPNAPPYVTTDGDSTPLLYWGYNDDGTWFNGFVLKGHVFARTVESDFKVYDLPLGLENPAPEYHMHFPPASVLNRKLYGDDPNFPASAGSVLLAPNPLHAQEISYFYDSIDPEKRPVVKIHFATLDIDPHYLGHDSQGSWLFNGTEIYLLKGDKLWLSDVHDAEHVPNDLRDGSPLYLSTHPGTAATSHGAPYAYNIVFSTAQDGSVWVSYTLKNYGPDDVPMKLKVMRPNAHALPPEGLPPVVLGDLNSGTWVWFGEGSDQGKAAIFYNDFGTGLSWVFVTLQQAQQYMTAGGTR
jgi:hypothetical protein